MSNWNRLALVTPPETEPLTLESAIAHLNLIGISDHDDNVTAYIADAIAQIDGPDGIGLCLITQTWRLSLDAWPRDGIRIPLRPIQTVDAITYLDDLGAGQTLAADQYVYDLDRKPLTIYPAEGVCWPSLKCAPGVVKVQFTAGYGDTPGDVPGDLVGAIKLIVGHRFENRDAVNVSSTELPLGATAVLGRYARSVA
jgi:uncharacterized phiE125 gp8 family phage protein